MATKTATKKRSTNGGDPKKKTLEVPQLKIGTMEFQLAALEDSTYLQHQFSEKAREQMRRAEQKRGKVAREAKDPEAEFRACLYVTKGKMSAPDDEPGKFYIPGVQIKTAMVSGAIAHGDKVNLPGSLVRRAIFVEDSPIVSFDELAIREDAVTVGRGGHELRYRPEFHGWTADVRLTFLPIIGPEQILNVLRMAGRAVGIGDWRPEKDGDHGRFDLSGNVVFTEPG